MFINIFSLFEVKLQPLDLLFGEEKSKQKYASGLFEIFTASLSSDRQTYQHTL